jgi:hypothetical protein
MAMSIAASITSFTLASPRFATCFALASDSAQCASTLLALGGVFSTSGVLTNGAASPLPMPSPRSPWCHARRAMSFAIRRVSSAMPSSVRVAAAGCASCPASGGTASIPSQMAWVSFREAGLDTMPVKMRMKPMPSMSPWWVLK